MGTEKRTCPALLLMMMAQEQAIPSRTTAHTYNKGKGIVPQS
jgi:hypothetical protein